MSELPQGMRAPQANNNMGNRRSSIPLPIRDKAMASRRLSVQSPPRLETTRAASRPNTMQDPELYATTTPLPLQNGMGRTNLGNQSIPLREMNSPAISTEQFPLYDPAIADAPFLQANAELNSNRLNEFSQGQSYIHHSPSFHASTNPSSRDFYQQNVEQSQIRGSQGVQARGHLAPNYVNVNNGEKSSARARPALKIPANINSLALYPNIKKRNWKKVTNMTSPYQCNPSARDRQDPEDFKGWKLDFDGKPMEAKAGGLAPGVLAYWKLDNKEEIFAAYRNEKRADGSVTHYRIEIKNEEDVKTLYDDFKGIIFQACTVDMFRGGAFADKVKFDSPLDDTIQFIYWSPVMTKENRWYFGKTIFTLYSKIISTLKTGKALDRKFIDKCHQELLGIKNFFDSDKKDPTPMPIDISAAWQKEFGDAWIEKFTLALKGGPDAPFQISVPPECVRDKNGLTIMGWDVSMDRMYAGHAVVRANTQTGMLRASAEDGSDYAEVIRSMGLKKGEQQVVTAGPSKASSSNARGIGAAEYGEEYNDRFEGAINNSDAQGPHLKDMLDRTAIVKQMSDEKKRAAVEIYKAHRAAEKAAAELIASEEAEKRKEKKKGGMFSGGSKKGKGKGKGKK